MGRDCFVIRLHQLFGTSDEHVQVCLTGVDDVRAYPQHYIEFNADSS